MHTIRLIGIVLSAAIAACTAQTRVDAQVSSYEFSAERMLRGFEQGHRGQAREFYSGLVVVLNRSKEHSPALVDSILDGLQQFATSSDHARLRSGALSFLAGAGGHSSSNPITEVPARLGIVYETAQDEFTRAAAVVSLGQQVHRVEAARILRGIAVQDSARQRAPSAAHDALYALTYLGAEGEGALRDLFTRGAVRERQAREAMAQLARERGWRR